MKNTAHICSSLLLTFILIFGSPIISFAQNSSPPSPLTPTQLQNLSAAGEEELKDIAGPVEIAETMDVLIYLMAAIIIIVFLVLGMLFLRKKKKRVMPSDPAQHARDQLNSAKILLVEHGEEAYAIRLEEILCEFLQAHHGCPAQCKTTAELLEYFEHNNAMKNYPHEQRKLLAACLKNVDLIKYAKSTPSTQTITQIEETFSQFIKYECNNGGEY